MFQPPSLGPPQFPLNAWVGREGPLSFVGPHGLSTPMPRCEAASLPAALAAAATHAKHLRALAVLFFWLLLNWSGANSAWQTEHRMAARMARLRQNRWSTRLCPAQDDAAAGQSNVLGSSLCARDGMRSLGLVRWRWGAVAVPLTIL